MLNFYNFSDYDLDEITKTMTLNLVKQSAQKLVDKTIDKDYLAKCRVGVIYRLETKRGSIGKRSTFVLADPDKNYDKSTHIESSIAIVDDHIYISQKDDNGDWHLMLNNNNDPNFVDSVVSLNDRVKEHYEWDNGETKIDDEASQPDYLKNMQNDLTEILDEMRKVIFDKLNVKLSESNEKLKIDRKHKKNAGITEITWNKPPLKEVPDEKDDEKAGSFDEGLYSNNDDKQENGWNGKSLNNKQDDTKLSVDSRNSRNKQNSWNTDSKKPNKSLIETLKDLDDFGCYSTDDGNEKVYHFTSPLMKIEVDCFENGIAPTIAIEASNIADDLVRKEVQDVLDVIKKCKEGKEND